MSYSNKDGGGGPDDGGEDDSTRKGGGDGGGDPGDCETSGCTIIVYGSGTVSPPTDEGDDIPFGLDPMEDPKGPIDEPTPEDLPLGYDAKKCPRCCGAADSPGPEAWVRYCYHNDPHWYCYQYQNSGSTEKRNYCGNNVCEDWGCPE